MAISPAWAQDLLIRACLAEGKEDLPTVVWRRARKRVLHHRNGVVQLPVHRLTSGYADIGGNRIVLTVGTDRTDQRRALLHELAHLLRPPGENHSAGFWDTAWRLYRWAGLPIRATAKREGEYRKGSTLAYARSRKAKEVVDEKLPGDYYPDVQR